MIIVGRARQISAINPRQVTAPTHHEAWQEVTDFRIVGDLYVGSDYTYLDEITVTQPDSVVAGGT